MKSLEFRASLEKFLRKYLVNRPLFLSLIRAKEAALYQHKLPFSKPILDVGCGDGFFAKTVFGQIDVGLDVADSRIKEADSQGVYKKIVIYDGQVMPFRSNTFTTVVSNCVFEHIPNIDQVISECYRVLKPGGKLIITVMAKPWEENLVGSLFLGNSYRAYMRRTQVHLNLFTQVAWKKQLTNAGFRVLEEVGYLDAHACRLIDVCHYISIPSLVTYLLFKRWVLWPDLQWYPVSFLANAITHTVESSKSGAIFFVLQKQA